MRSSADLLLTIINEILDFSKIEAGKLEIEAVRFDLHELLESLCDVVEFSASGKSLAFDDDMAPALPRYLLGDSLRIRQILLNLTSNAVKFTSKGRIRLTLPAPARDAEGRATLRFTVSDTGIGIPDDKLGQHFTPFQRADTSTTRVFGGTGLGLSISRRLAELMGGGIEVESWPGVGSRFALVLEGRIDHAAMPRVIGQRVAEQLGFDLRPDGPVLGVQYGKLAFSRVGSAAAWKLPFDAALGAMWRSGAVADILARNGVRCDACMRQR